MTKLTSLETMRSQLADRIRNFEAQPATLTAKEIIVKLGEQPVRMKFEDGKCVAADPPFGWAHQWPFRELEKYFHSRDLQYQEVRK